MDPSAIHNLILNLKLQLLGLPNLARWGLISFAGIIVVREIATAAWNVRERRRAQRADAATPHNDPITRSPDSPQALPASKFPELDLAPEALLHRRPATPIP